MSKMNLLGETLCINLCMEYLPAYVSLTYQYTEQKIHRTRSMHFSCVQLSSMPEGNRTKSNYIEQNRTVMVRFSSFEFGNRTLILNYTKIKSLKFLNAQ